MKLGTMAAGIAAAWLLTACGGSDVADTPRPNQKMMLAESGVVGDSATFAGRRGDYTIARTAGGYVVSQIGGTSTTLGNLQTLYFDDIRLNLGIGDKSKTIAPADLKLLIELYVAFFNRVPDADGLSYWIDQVKAGHSIEGIADSFYAAALLYSDLTGYSTAMGNYDFVLRIYKTVLGRSGSTMPPDADVQYWSSRMGKGGVSKGTLVRTMLDSAHTFTNDPTWGWVSRLLDNKVAVAEYVALQQGLNYNTPDESIVNAMAVAAAVTPTDTTLARRQIGFADTGFDLTAPR